MKQITKKKEEKRTKRNVEERCRQQRSVMVAGLVMAVAMKKKESNVKQKKRKLYTVNEKKRRIKRIRRNCKRSRKVEKQKEKRKGK